MPTRACPQTQALPRKNSYSPLLFPLGLSSYHDGDVDDDVDDEDDEGDDVEDEHDDLHIGLHHHLVGLENVCGTEGEYDHCARLRRPFKQLMV